MKTNAIRIIGCLFAALLFANCTGGQAQLAAQRQALEQQAQRQAQLEAQLVAQRRALAQQAQRQAGAASQQPPDCQEIVAKRAATGAVIGFIVDCVLFGCTPVSSLLVGAAGGALEGSVECMANQ